MKKTPAYPLMLRRGPFRSSRPFQTYSVLSWAGCVNRSAVKHLLPKMCTTPMCASSPESTMPFSMVWSKALPGGSSPDHWHKVSSWMELLHRNNLSAPTGVAGKMTAGRIPTIHASCVVVSLIHSLSEHCWRQSFMAATHPVTTLTSFAFRSWGACEQFSGETEQKPPFDRKPGSTCC